MAKRTANQLESRESITRKKLRTETAPGQVVSIDQLVRTTPGFIPNHRGIPTAHLYVGATVFVDHFSNFTYIHLMEKIDG